MSAGILVVFVLPIFFVRDCFLLRMGRVATTLARLKIYAATVLASVIVLSVVTISFTTERLLKEWASLPVCLAGLLFYGALLVMCIWFKRTERHRFAWRIAALPNPILAGGIVLLARIILPIHSPSATALGATLVACLWCGIIGLSVWRMRAALMDVPDLDFSLQLAGLVNSAAVVLPFLGLFVTGGFGWSEILRKLGTILSAD
jgi:hypothetical protein